jgi:uncharacterized linocin/CFP29 family protein
MGDTGFGLGWTAAQWDKVNTAVTEAFGKASVASTFLPCYGPLAGSAETVRQELLTVTAEQSQLKVADDATLKLITLTVKVELSGEQVADEGLSSALLAFRRGANTLAQVEDDIVFNGWDKASKAPPTPRSLRTKAVVTSDHPLKIDGLLSVAPLDTLIAVATGQDVVDAVIRAVSNLELASHPGPFACVLGTDLFSLVHAPNLTMIMPADRLAPVLKGPILRSSNIDRRKALVVSLGSSTIDIVVATPPKTQFLQLTENAKYLFRVYEKFVLRIKDPFVPAVVAFEVP